MAARIPDHLRVQVSIDSGLGPDHSQLCSTLFPWRTAHFEVEPPSRIEFATNVYFFAVYPRLQYDEYVP